MPLSNDVELPKDRTPAFPPFCIGCGSEDPTSRFRASTRAIGWWSVLLRGGEKHHVDAPACSECASFLRLQARVRFAAVIVSIVVGAFVTSQLIGTGGLARSWLVAVGGLIGTIPFLLWSITHPPAFDLTATSTSITCEFSDPAYAEAFAELNGAEVE
jgi:hypothetical protein